VKAGSIRLPESTDATVKGPKLQFEGSSMIVEYDHENEDGSVRWVRLRFAGVLSFEYRQAVCCDAEHITNFHEVQCAQSSAWLDGLLKGWTDAVGWQKWEREKGGRERFSHFRIFFDDAGCLDVAAENLKLE
jgi:hypothetical protein